MFSLRSKAVAAAAMALAATAAAPLAQAQVPAVQRAGFNVPIGQVAAPNTPGGGVVIGNHFYATDQVNGLRQYLPLDPANPDPIDDGTLVFDTAIDGTSIGGTELCILFCSGGQVAYDGNQTIYVTAYDHAKGQPGSLTTPGVLRFIVDPVGGFIEPQSGPLAPNFGLAGNQPTAIALGPDGNLYVGFLKNGNVVRITNPNAELADPVQAKTQVVQSVGTAPNGRPVRGLAFVGPNLYLATTAGLAVIPNAIAPTCLGGCNGVPVPDGFTGIAHLGITTDGINRIYEAVPGAVWRYTISTGHMDLVSTGGPDPNTGAALTFAFVGGHSNLLQLDRLGNLWIGDDVGDGRLNFDGRIWYISAGALATIP
jgi:hypothetical protein